MDKDVKECQGPTIETPFGRLLRHRRNLDDILVSIRGYTDESKLVRMFIVGQIEAIDWAVRMFEV